MGGAGGYICLERAPANVTIGYRTSESERLGHFLTHERLYSTIRRARANQYTTETHIVRHVEGRGSEEEQEHSTPTPSPPSDRWQGKGPRSPLKAQGGLPMLLLRRNRCVVKSVTTRLTLPTFQPGRPFRRTKKRLHHVPKERRRRHTRLKNRVHVSVTRRTFVLMVLHKASTTRRRHDPIFVNRVRRGTIIRLNGTRVQRIKGHRPRRVRTFLVKGHVALIQVITRNRGRLVGRPHTLPSRPWVAVNREIRAANVRNSTLRSYRPVHPPRRGAALFRTTRRSFAFRTHSFPTVPT